MAIDASSAKVAFSLHEIPAVSWVPVTAFVPKPALAVVREVAVCDALISVW